MMSMPGCLECSAYDKCTKCDGNRTLIDSYCSLKCAKTSDCSNLTKNYDEYSKGLICIDGACTRCVTSQNCETAFPGLGLLCTEFSGGASGKVCGECETNNDCLSRPKGKNRCDLKSRTLNILTPKCVECLSHNDCSDSGNPFCDPTSGTCTSNCTGIVLDNYYNPCSNKLAIE